MAIGRVNTGGGGSGGTLSVTGVAGDTVTAAKSGKTYSRTFNSSGIATFKGLATGTWAITMTDGSQSVTQNVTINADYTLTMAYFSALITTTWPEGSTCSCSDGTSTLYAPDTSGSYTFNVPNKGTWTVTATNGDKTASKSVSITAEGQTESVTLAYEYVLYEAGTKYVTFTENKPLSYGTISWGTKNVTIELPSNTGGNYSTTFVNTSKIDLSNYSHLKCTLSSLDITSTSSLHCFQLGVSSASSPGWGSNMIASASLGNSKNSSAKQTVDIDISNVSSGTIQMGVAGGQGYSVTAVITKIWLE